MVQQWSKPICPRRSVEPSLIVKRPEGVPEYDLLLLDVKTRSLRPLSPRFSAQVGFFNAVWSRDGRRVAFLSIDRSALVRAWVWTVGTAAASLVPNVDPRVGSGGDQGAGRPLTSFFKIWEANGWLQGVKLGRAESFTYKTNDGSSQIAWLLLPPDHVRGTRVPVVTVVYPGNVYRSTEPGAFSPYDPNFEHPQLFAALGYAVLLPSMPAPKEEADSHALTPLPNGVIPAIDAAIANGHADPDRIAVLGQSSGGFAVLGLITQTNRFRSAIASAGFSNFQSLYGTFYGQFRYGDAGHPEAAQVLRMLQLEKGAMSLGGPPWKEADRYREHSAIHLAHKVETPLLLIHGELDFIPIQQSEEFFTALFRQDKRVRFLRYTGEGHTINARANVLHMWQQLEQWLKETMLPRSGPNR